MAAPARVFASEGKLECETSRQGEPFRTPTWSRTCSPRRASVAQERLLLALASLVLLGFLDVLLLTVVAFAHLILLCVKKGAYGFFNVGILRLRT
jgi:hypothetical protein